MFTLIYMFLMLNIVKNLIFKIFGDNLEILDLNSCELKFVRSTNEFLKVANFRKTRFLEKFSLNMASLLQRFIFITNSVAFFLF